MAIPAIKPYAMPTTARSVAPWTPDPRRAALLIHDMQRYFVDRFPAGQPPVVELLANVAALRDAAHAAGIPVVYTAQPGVQGRPERGLLLDLWGPGMRADPAERGIVPALAPRPGDTVLTKSRYSAFHRTDLAGVLARAGRDQLVVCGVYAHLGCLLTACDAFSRDIEVFLVSDAVADFDAARHAMALEYAARSCAVTMSARRLLAHLRARPAREGAARARPGAPR